MSEAELTTTRLAKLRPSSAVGEAIPPRADRRTLARLVSDRFFPCSPGQLRTWPVDWRLVGSRAIGETEQVFAEAARRLAEAPVISARRG